MTDSRDMLQGPVDALVDEQIIADIKRAAEGDSSFLKELVTKVEDGTRAGIAELKAGAGNALSIMHRIKGSAGSIGGRGLSNRLRELEARAKDNGSLPTADDIAGLSDLAERSFTELRRHYFG